MRIRVSAAVAGEQAVVSVEDEGPGVPEPLRERVFDKFFRYAPERGGDVRPPGTGMGLSIARGIVEAHGGRIWISGRPAGPGCVVNVALPIGDEEGQEAVVEAPRTRREEATP